MYLCRNPLIDGIDSMGEGVRGSDWGGGENVRYIETAYHLCDDRLFCMQRALYPAALRFGFPETIIKGKDYNIVDGASQPRDIPSG